MKMPDGTWEIEKGDEYVAITRYPQTVNDRETGAVTDVYWPTNIITELTTSLGRAYRDGWRAVDCDDFAVLVVRRIGGKRDAVCTLWVENVAAGRVFATVVDDAPDVIERIWDEIKGNWGP